MGVAMRHVPVTATVEATALTRDHGAPVTHPTRVVTVTPIARPLAVSLDCSDPARLAEFWQQVVGGTIDAAVVATVAIGATKVGPLVEEPSNFFQVMRDPEGNEFCFILRKPPMDG